MANMESVHLQDFPNLDGMSSDENLVRNMDSVREICSLALSIRDRHNLRVRLPLNSVRIIGEFNPEMESFKDIIADEVNVKNVVFESNIGNLATFAVDIDLKTMGAKLGSKTQDVVRAKKANEWKDLGNGGIEIAGVELSEGEYQITLLPINIENTGVLANNKTLVELDINVTPELELEGLARDLVRLIQQDRKDSSLDVSDRIGITLDGNLENIVEPNRSYIMEQTLADEMVIGSVDRSNPHFKHQFNGGEIIIGIVQM